MVQASLPFLLLFIFAAGCMPNAKNNSKDQKTSNKSGFLTGSTTDSSQSSTLTGNKFPLGSYKTADQLTKEKFEYIFQYVYGRKVIYTSYDNNDYDLAVYPEVVIKWADNIKKIIEIYNVRMSRLPTKREMIYWASVPVTNNYLYSNFEKTVETLQSKSTQFLEDYYRAAGQTEWEQQPVDPFVFSATSSATAIAPASAPLSPASSTVTTTNSPLIPALASSSTLSAGVKAIYQHIGRSADKIDAEGAAFFQSRLDSGVSLEILKAQAMGAVLEADNKLLSRGVFQTSQQLLNGNETYRALYYRTMALAPVLYPPVNPISAMTCDQIIEKLAWETATQPTLTVTATRTGLELAFKRKSATISMPFTNFDPTKAGFSVRFIEGGKTIIVPSEAYSFSPSSETQKGFAFAYQGDYGSVNLKFHLTRHRNFVSFSQPTVELSCSGRSIATGTHNVKPMVDLTSPPSCKSILGKVVGNYCVFLGPCAKNSRASAEQFYAAQKGYSTCWSALPEVNPDCPTDVDAKYFGRCVLTNPAELP